MIIFEVPHRGKPKIWSVEDRAEFIEIMRAEDTVGVYSEKTGMQLLDMYGAETLSELAEEYAELANLIAKHGLDATYHRDCSSGDHEEWLAGTGDELGAYQSYLFRQLSDCYFFTSRADALERLQYIKPRQVKALLDFLAEEVESE